MTLEPMFQYAALAGGLLTVAAYLPQLNRLFRVKNSTGNSLAAWYLWLVGAALPLLYAIHIKDRVFTVLQISYVLCIGGVIILIHKYKTQS